MDSSARQRPAGKHGSGCATDHTGLGRVLGEIPLPAAGGAAGPAGQTGRPRRHRRQPVMRARLPKARAGERSIRMLLYSHSTLMVCVCVFQSEFCLGGLQVWCKAALTSPATVSSAGGAHSPTASAAYIITR